MNLWSLTACFDCTSLSTNWVFLKIPSKTSSITAESPHGQLKWSFEVCFFLSWVTANRSYIYRFAMETITEAQHSVQHYPVLSSGRPAISANHCEWWGARRGTSFRIHSCFWCHLLCQSKTGVRLGKRASYPLKRKKKEKELLLFPLLSWLSVDEWNLPFVIKTPNVFVSLWSGCFDWLYEILEASNQQTVMMTLSLIWAMWTLEE